VPFHESAAPPEDDELTPTASQKVAEVHDTLLRLSALGGMFWLDQVEPFHESAAMPEWSYPTASQKGAEVHETP
jgi:hypothetical protein